ncbi:hypothetical protein PG996_010678 [Apiospora saccharicola]|uniref:NADP-dependent oxidoreductase domain-containing protein n=1 Tax=Apiospora saccharicola TaxID=335842 RepID=A0ABR1UP94_9PEZI
MATSLTPKAPQLIYGCGGLGQEIVGEAAVAELLQILQEAGVVRLDTAALYPPHDIGASQRLLGQMGAAAQLGFTVDTKVMVSLKTLAGTLEPAKIEKSVDGSVRDLRLNGEGGGGGEKKIHVLYAHGPDVATPLRDQAAGFDAEHRKGMFDELGVCNFPAKMLEEYLDICEREGYVQPSVYQGLYNLIDRRHEGAVLDLVRRHGMRFVAHSPHAGGFLQGSLTSGRVEGTRFAQGNIMSMDARRYDTEKHHAAVRALDELLARHDGGMSKTDVAVRWLAFHSQLKSEDAIIFGGSKVAQVKATVAAVGKGPLPDDIVAGLDEIWTVLSAA